MNDYFPHLPADLKGKWLLSWDKSVNIINPTRQMSEKGCVFSPQNCAFYALCSILNLNNWNHNLYYIAPLILFYLYFSYIYLCKLIWTGVKRSLLAWLRIWILRSHFKAKQVLKKWTIFQSTIPKISMIRSHSTIPTPANSNCMYLNIFCLTKRPVHSFSFDERYSKQEIVSWFISINFYLLMNVWWRKTFINW